MFFILLIKNIIYIDLGINKENFNFEGCMEKKDLRLFNSIKYI